MEDRATLENKNPPEAPKEGMKSKWSKRLGANAFGGKFLNERHVKGFAFRFLKANDRTRASLYFVPDSITFG